MVIAIIGILASVVLVAINPARRIGEANDSKRKTAMGDIRTALAAYYTANGRYPDPIRDARGGWDDSDLGTFMQPLINAGFLKTAPLDPINGNGYYFSYYRYAAGQYGCDPNKGAFYVLGVKKFEAAPKEGGFSCSGRDWGLEFAAVYGEYEKP